MREISRTLDWSSTLAQVKEAVKGDPFWEPYLATSKNDYRLSFHLAIFVEPYLQYILDGKKTVESRFSVHRIPPFGHVQRNDVLLLKRSGGPITGLCQAGEVWYYELDPRSWKHIRQEFTQMLCAQDPEFWTAREHATFATLISLKNVRLIDPIKYLKQDRRGWVVLTERHSQLQLPLGPKPIIIGFSGGLGSGKSTISAALSEATGWRRLSFGDYVRQEARRRNLGDSRGVLQEIGAALVAEPDEFCRNVLNAGGWNHGETLILDGIRHFTVLDSLKRLAGPNEVVLIHIQTKDEVRAKRLKKRGRDDKDILRLLETHSTEKDVHDILLSNAHLIINGVQPISKSLKKILEWLKISQEKRPLSLPI